MKNAFAINQEHQRFFQNLPMKKILLVAVCWNFLISHAQIEGTKNRLLSINGLEMSGFMYVGQSTVMRIEDFQNLALDDFPEIDLTGQNTWMNTLGTMGGGFQMALNFNIRKMNGQELWGRPLLRTGFAYFSSNNSSIGYHGIERYAYDTIFTTFQGVTTTQPIDSVYYRSTSLRAQTDRIRLHASILWQTNPEKRWKAYAGIGFGLGVSMNSNINIGMYEGYYFVAESSSSMMIYNDNNVQSWSDYKGEVLRAKPWYDCNIFIPIGVDFRLGKKENILKHVHLFLESMPMIYLQKAQAIRVQSIGAFAVSPGVRVVF